MSMLSDNIRYLRAQLSISQQKVADNLMITRGRYAKYEDGASEPPIEILIKLSRFFHLSVDLLISVDLRNIPTSELLKLPDNRILFPVSIDSSGENMIELIPHKARMGYLTGYSDPEFIEGLRSISLPFLSNGKFRAFPVEGDSMPPHKEGSFIVGRYIENCEDVKDGKTYVLLTRNEGIVYKRLNRNGKNKLILSSDNAFYTPYEIELSEILEIWEFACSIATKESEPDDINSESVKEMFNTLRCDIRSLSNKIIKK